MTNRVGSIVSELIDLRYERMGRRSVIALVGAGGCREPRCPASISHLGRCSCPADRCPNSSSLFLLQAAVVAVAQDFLRRPLRRRRCCSNPPLIYFCKVVQKQKHQRSEEHWCFGGRGWIRTTEALSSRFTVCPHWPLGNTPIFNLCPCRTTRLF